MFDYTRDTRVDLYSYKILKLQPGMGTQNQNISCNAYNQYPLKDHMHHIEGMLHLSVETVK